MVAGTENQRASTRPHTKPLNKRKLNTSVLASKFSIFVFEAELSVHLNSVIAACGRESSLISALGNKLGRYRVYLQVGFFILLFCGLSLILAANDYILSMTPRSNENLGLLCLKRFVLQMLEYIFLTCLYGSIRLCPGH